MTGGGDCPGLNPVIRAVVRTAIRQYGWEVFGVEDAFSGLVDLNYRSPHGNLWLTEDVVYGIIRRGGTILGTSNRSDPFHYRTEENGQVVEKDIFDQVLMATGRHPNTKGLGLAEAGVTYIEVSTGNVWDQHSDLVGGHTKNAAKTDLPTAALLRDLKARGMLDDTLVVWGGEFGRTPVLQGGNGRDHNPQGFTMWLAGGGFRGGHAHGSTDEFGYYAVQDRVHMHDLHATILYALGVDHERLTYRYAGRDFRLTDVHGNVVKEVMV